MNGLDFVEISVVLQAGPEASSAKLLNHTFLENLSSPDVFEHTLGIGKARYATRRQPIWMIASPELF